MTRRSRARSSRRSFLKQSVAAGAAASLFPWLRAAGQSLADSKLLLYYTPHGTVWDAWRPSGGELDFTLPYILEPLERHRDDLVIVDGLAIDDPYEHRVPHTYDMPALFTGSPLAEGVETFYREDHGVSYGWNLGVSIDQTIAERLQRPTLHRSIELGVQVGGSHPASRMIYTGPASPRQPLGDPVLAFDQLFAGASVPEPDTSQMQRRAAILDAVAADLAAVRPTLSANDRIRLDAHESALEELQQSLSPLQSACELPAAPPGGNLDVTIDQQGALLVAALACGQTHIGSMQVTKADNDGALYPWVGIDSAGHHALSHDSGAEATQLRTDLYRWYTERFALLLDRLAATPDTDGARLLDNTMVIWGSEIGVGWTHDVSNVPFIVAGGRAQGLRAGRYIRHTGRHNRLLVSAAHFMGLGDITRYGSMDDAEGPLPGLLG